MQEQLIEDIKEVSIPLQSEVVTEKPVAKAVPKFDHTRPAGQVFGQDHKYLEQDGNYFSFGEFSRSLQRYCPEPIYVPKGNRTTAQLMGELKAALFKMAELEGTLRKMQENILNNLEAFQKDG